MIVKISKTMCKALNNALKERKKSGVYSSINCFKYDGGIPIDDYIIAVGDIYTADYNGDYNSLTQKFKAIKAVYNDNCYSFDRYISTNDLHNCFKNSNKSYDDFIEQVFTMYEI